MTSSTTRATTSARSSKQLPQVDPIADANTLADTLSYAMQDDADPSQVFKEITAVLAPYCKHRSTLGHLRSLLEGFGRQDDEPLAEAIECPGRQDQPSMSGDELHAELLRIDALVSGAGKLIDGIADDDATKATALLETVRDEILYLQHHCTVSEGGTAAASIPTHSSASTAMDIDAIRSIRRALLIGLASFGEIERLTGQAGEMPDGCRPIHPTGSAETVGDFADALRHVDHIETDLLGVAP